MFLKINIPIVTITLAWLIFTRTCNFKHALKLWLIYPVDDIPSWLILLLSKHRVTNTWLTFITEILKYNRIMVVFRQRFLCLRERASGSNSTEINCWQMSPCSLDQIYTTWTWGWKKAILLAHPNNLFNPLG